jgi:hypothetical protein
MEPAAKTPDQRWLPVSNLEFGASAGECREGAFSSSYHFCTLEWKHCVRGVMALRSGSCNGHVTFEIDGRTWIVTFLELPTSCVTTTEATAPKAVFDWDYSVSVTP